MAHRYKNKIFSNESGLNREQIGLFWLNSLISPPYLNRFNQNVLLAGLNLLFAEFGPSSLVNTKLRELDGFSVGSPASTGDLNSKCPKHLRVARGEKVKT